MKRVTRKALIEQIEALHPKFIRKRDGHRCVVCGSMRNPTCGHIFSRRNLATRWDISEDGNCHCQCWSCNFSHGGTGMRGPMDKYPYFKWYIEKFGTDKLDELHRRATSIRKWTMDELLELRDTLLVELSH